MYKITIYHYQQVARRAGMQTVTEQILHENVHRCLERPRVEGNRLTLVDHPTKLEYNYGVPQLLKWKVEDLEATAGP